MADGHLENAWGMLERKLVGSSKRRQTKGRRTIERIWRRRQHALQREMDRRRGG